MALQQHVAGGMPSHAALLAATAAASWPLSNSPEALSLLSSSPAPLAAGLQSMLLPDPTMHAAVQAAAMQHQLALLQVRRQHRDACLCSCRRRWRTGLACMLLTSCTWHPLLPTLQAGDASGLLSASAAPSSLLAAAAGVRQPLLPLSLNLGHHNYHQAPAVAPSCYGLGM